MLFKLDENVPEGLIAELTGMGHDAETCRHEGLAGAEDQAVASRSQSEGRVLVTFDRDFSDIRRYPPGSHSGIVILRLQSQDVRSCKTAFLRLLAAVPEADFAGSLITVEDSRVRLRRAAP
jgi:predicted nuclease of predicted toxin-antitoxin system